MSERDVEIGRIVQAWREPRSQQWVADEMRSRDHKWSQATVWGVEKGERPLKFTEAVDLSALFERDVAELSSDLPSTLLYEAWRRAGVHLASMEASLDQFLHARQAVRELLAEAEVGNEMTERAETVAGIDLAAGVAKRVAQFEKQYGEQSG